MDLRGLESIQWRGFSDSEIQQLHRKKHGNVRKEKVSRSQVEEDVPKADQKEDEGKDEHRSCEKIITEAVHNGKDVESGESFDAVLDVAVNEADFAKQYVSFTTEW